LKTSISWELATAKEREESLRKLLNSVCFAMLTCHWSFKIIKLTKLFIIVPTRRCLSLITLIRHNPGSFIPTMITNTSVVEHSKATVIKRWTTSTIRGKWIMISMLLQEECGHLLPFLWKIKWIIFLMVTNRKLC
jgi:hypothetical protein